jgi:Trk K+ transport system NAD-binding subunit
VFPFEQAIFRHISVTLKVKIKTAGRSERDLRPLQFKGTIISVSKNVEELIPRDALTINKGKK